MKLYGQKIEPGQEIENGGFRIGLNRKTSKSKSKGKKNNKNANGGEEEFDEKIGNLLQNTYRKKLLELLRAIQLYGVKTMQHMTKPELYSGSWLEKINNANDFFNYITRLPPQEAILSIYNVLYPYSDKLPKAQGDEPSLANFFNLNNPNNFIKTDSNQKDINDEFNIEINRNINSNNSEIAILKEQIKKLNKKIDESREQAENAEIAKLKLEVEKYQSENDTLKQQSNNLTTQISLLHENVRNYEKKQDKLQKNVDSQKDKLIKALNNQIGNLSIEMNILRNDNLNMTQKGAFNKKGGNGGYLNPKLIDTQSNLKSLTLEEEKNIYVFKNLCNKTNKGLYNILLDYDRDNDFYLLKQEFISVMDFIQLPFDQRDTILKVSSFFDREENKVILLNQFLFNIIYKFNMMKKSVEDLYKELENKSKNKYIKKEDLIKTLEDFMIRKEDIDGLINNWEYKDKEELINIDELIKHLKQREVIINDIIDINNELKFGNEIIMNNIDYNLNENDELDNQSKSEHSNINKNNNFSEKINYGKESENENNIANYDYNNNKKINNETINSINNNINKENDKNNEENINNDYKEKENNENEIKNENEKEIEENNNNENQNDNEENYYDDFNNQAEEEEKNDNNISNEIEQSKNDEFDTNNNNINEDEEDKKDDDSPSKKKKKKSTSKKKKKSKSKKSKEKLNIDEIINGELKVQVTNIENVMIPKNISIPCSFSLTCSIEGIDKILKSREVTTDDLRNVSFNWATRILLKKRTLKDLSSFCNIGLTVEQNNKNISLGNCQFAWTKCLYKKNWDKFAINEFYQVLTERKYKKIPMGNIKILAKFIPFGSSNSNYDKKGKKKKTPTNLNGIAEEPSVHSSISNKNENDNNINEDSLDQNNINIEENKDIKDEEEFIEENQGNQVIKGFDVEITNVSDKEELINKNLFLTVTAIEDNNEQEKINKEKLSDILQNLPSTQQFNVYSYKNNNRIKVIFYLKDEQDNNVGILPIILSNKESHLEKTDKFNIKTTDDGKNYVFFLKITINTTEDI